MTFKLLASTIAVTVAISSPAFAQGGNDPIPGIDIIIKKDPSSRPMEPGSFGEKDIGLTYNADAEKLNVVLRKLVDKTLEQNDVARSEKTDISEMVKKTAWALSKQSGDGDAGSSSFSYLTADGKTKMTVTIWLQGDKPDKDAAAIYPTGEMADRDDDDRDYAPFSANGDTDDQD